MKDLSNYLVEKLKLSDINKDSLDGRWVDANKLKEKDLEEWNILLSRNGRYYILAEDYIAGPLISALSRSSKSFKGDYYLIRKNEENLSGHSYINFTREYINFPKHYRAPDFNIVKVYTRKRKYKNIKELEEDLELLYDGYLVKL